MHASMRPVDVRSIHPILASSPQLSPALPLPPFLLSTGHPMSLHQQKQQQQHQNHSLHNPHLHHYHHHHHQQLYHDVSPLATHRHDYQLERSPFLHRRMDMLHGGAADPFRHDARSQPPRDYYQHLEDLQHRRHHHQHLNHHQHHQDLSYNHGQYNSTAPHVQAPTKLAELQSPRAAVDASTVITVGDIEADMSRATQDALNKFHASDQKREPVERCTRENQLRAGQSRGDSYFRCDQSDDDLRIENSQSFDSICSRILDKDSDLFSPTKTSNPFSSPSFHRKLVPSHSLPSADQKTDAPTQLQSPPSSSSSLSSVRAHWPNEFGDDGR